MNLRSLIVIFAIAAMPMCLLAQQRENPSVLMPTNADAERFFQLISSDKEKTQWYCEFNASNARVGQDDKQKTALKIEELERKFEMTQMLAEYVALIIGLERLDLSSKEFHRINLVFERLDRLCAKN